MYDPHKSNSGNAG
jgi:hypothetical protein